MAAVKSHSQVRIPATRLPLPGWEGRLNTTQAQLKNTEVKVEGECTVNLGFVRAGREASVIVGWRVGFLGLLVEGRGYAV